MLRVVCTTTSPCLPAPPGPGNGCPEEGTSLLPREQAGAPEAAPPWHGVGSSQSIVWPISGTHVAPGPVPSRSERLHGEPGGTTAPAGSPGAGRGGGGIVCFGFLALFAHQHLCVRSWDKNDAALAAANLFECQFQVAGGQRGGVEPAGICADMHVGQPVLRRGLSRCHPIWGGTPGHGAEPCSSRHSANLLLPALPASPEVAVTLCLACIAPGRTSCCTPGWAGTGSPCPLPAGEGPRHVTGILPGGGWFSLRGTRFVCLESSRAGSPMRRMVWEHGCIPGAGAFSGVGCPRGVGVLFGSCWPASRGAASLLWQCGCWHKMQPKL